MYSSFSKSDGEEKHKVFISFYHKDDKNTEMSLKNCLGTFSLTNRLTMAI